MKLLPFLLCVISSSLNLGEWNRGHEADANQLLRVSIALTVQNAHLGVETLLRISDPTSPDYSQHLSARDVARMFEPKPNAVSDVMKWLGESGIDQSQVNSSYGGDHLYLNLSIQEASLLLETTFYHQTHQETGQEQIACEHYHIPESLSGSIDYILAASPVKTHQQVSRQQVVLNDKVPALAPLPPGCFKQTTLSCLRYLYRIADDIIPHPNNSFGIFEPSWFSWLPEDLDKFFGQMQKNLVGHRPKVDAINGGYLQRNLTGPHWNQEANLDFEYAMALTSPQEVTNVQVGSFEQVGNLDNMLAAFDKYYCDPINPGYKKYPDFYPPGCNATACDCGSSSPPKVLSISWGWTEAGFTSNYLQRQCLEFLKLGLMGTTVVVSVSDHGTASGSGSFCIDDGTGNATSGRFSPTFPSSCPWVTSVGGTQMLQPTNPHMPTATINETAFHKVVSGQIASSGGGFSNVFLAPPYQLPNVALYKEIEKDHLDKIQDRFSSIGRGYPDVAARADDYMIVTNGQWRPVSGTSASNPVFASIITLINSERMHAGKGPVGFINPVLYSNPDILNDVLTGANQGCGIDPAFRAARGWDAVTGLGTPDYEQMRRLFMSLS
ncbi:peptidase S8/S53 domain-containing protein [Xylaria sp. FL1042]|nr:peptidase S8/S53 domain-containing protein [Xylaria sp. FL1042]